MKTKNTSGRILLMTSKPSGMAFDELGETQDPIDLIVRWARQNLTSQDIDRLCQELMIEAANGRPDPDANEDEVEGPVEPGQAVSKGRQAQDAGMAMNSYEKLFGPAKPPPLRNWARGDDPEYSPRSSGGFAQDSADDGSYEKLFGVRK
jgi:hypothetical protein